MDPSKVEREGAFSGGTIEGKKKKRPASPEGLRRTTAKRPRSSSLNFRTKAKRSTSDMDRDSRRPSSDGVVVDPQEESSAPHGARAWDNSLPFHESDFVRVVASCLQGLGYTKTARTLENESGHRAEPDTRIASMLTCVSAGRWEEALSLLSDVQFSPPRLHMEARAILLRHRFLELIEDKRLGEALVCLRDELSPLFSFPGRRVGQEMDGLQGEGIGDREERQDSRPLVPDQLHALSALLLAPSPMSLRRLSTPGRGYVSRTSARAEARKAMQQLLAEGGMSVPPCRLESLVAQALHLQTLRCLYHNTPETKLDLCKDHNCGRRMLPQVTTHVLEEHEDEVWCCAFSNGGGMLATSSADARLMLWGLDGDGNDGGVRAKETRGHGRAPTLLKRIAVRDGPPHFIAWSPDDRSVLTCGASPLVTRWSVETGTEEFVYQGEHTEGITGISWLRDGRGFVSAGLDRKVVVWSLVGSVLARWNGPTRIRAMVLAPPPPSSLPSKSSYAFAKGAGASRNNLNAGSDEDGWPGGPGGGGEVSNGSGIASGSGSGPGTGSRNGSRNGASLGSSPASPSSPLSPSSFSRSVLYTTTRGAVFDPAYFGMVDELQRAPRPSARGSSANNSNAYGAHHGRGPSGGSGGADLRRCRLWLICREDTIKALDIDIWEYGDSMFKRGSGSGSGESQDEEQGERGREAGAGGAATEKETGADDDPGSGEGGVRGEGDRGMVGSGRRRRIRGGSSGPSPRPYSGGKKNAPSCLITEGPQKSFPGEWITHLSASALAGRHHLLLHLSGGKLALWNSLNGATVRKYSGHKQTRNMVRSTFGGLHDGFIASGSEDSLVYIWHRERGELFGSFAGHAGTVNAVAWNPCRPGMLASVSDDRTVRLWQSIAAPEPRRYPPEEQRASQGNASRRSPASPPSSPRPASVASSGGGAKHARERNEGGENESKNDNVDEDNEDNEDGEDDRRRGGQGGNGVDSDRSGTAGDASQARGSGEMSRRDWGMEMSHADGDLVEPKSPDVRSVGSGYKPGAGGDEGDGGGVTGVGIGVDVRGKGKGRGRGGKSKRPAVGSRRGLQGRLGVSRERGWGMGQSSACMRDAWGGGVDWDDGDPNNSEGFSARIAALRW